MNEEIEFIIDSSKEQMQHAVEHLAKEFRNIRAGKATPSMLAGVSVDYYGSKTPLSQVANVNTPDALLYHLPFSKIVNEHKIIIGLSNLHSRFGHISIFQYISSFFNNSFFHKNGVLFPISLITSFFLFYS